MFWQPRHGDVTHRLPCDGGELPQTRKPVAPVQLNLLPTRILINTQRKPRDIAASGDTFRVIGQLRIHNSTSIVCLLADKDKGIQQQLGVSNHTISCSGKGEPDQTRTTTNYTTFEALPSPTIFFPAVPLYIPVGSRTRIR